jgi:hypothetical protein
MALAILIEETHKTGTLTHQKQSQEKCALKDLVAQCCNRESN